jgi:hypothetical protein
MNKNTYTESQGTEYIFHIGQVPHCTKKITLILLTGTIKFVHIELVSALFTFRLGQVLICIYICTCDYSVIGNLQEKRRGVI